MNWLACTRLARWEEGGGSAGGGGGVGEGEVLGVGVGRLCFCSFKLFTHSFIDLHLVQAICPELICGWHMRQILILSA
jgi:hypothetical protein